MARRRTYGFSFSWKRLLGTSGLKNRISRKIGIPLTRDGRRRKVGRLLGCCLPFTALVGLVGALTAATVATHWAIG